MYYLCNLKPNGKPNVPLWKGTEQEMKDKSKFLSYPYKIISKKEYLKNPIKLNHY